jgi:hypothetical protein
MRLALESWYVLREVTRNGEQLHARFVPDHFHSGIVDPVLILGIQQPDDAADAVEKLNRFSKEPLLEVEATSKTLGLSAEYDDVPTVISGQSVTFRRETYSSADMQHVIGELEKALERSDSQIFKLLGKLGTVESFVDDLKRRAQAKRSLTTRTTTVLDTQIQLLERVLGKLRDA